MSEIKEKILKDYPDAVTFKSTKTILEQMEKNICKIILNDGSKGTGFFCKIPFPDNNNKLPVLITNNHVINDFNNNVTFYYNYKYTDIIIKDRIKYTNKEYDITIIEIKENKDNIKDYLEIDEEIMKEGSNKSYIKESIYVLQYPEEKKLVSFGILKDIMIDKNYNFNHLCCTNKGSSGSPIINLKNNKVIGIHKEAGYKYNYNKGLFLNYPIKDFINVHIKNEIKELNKIFNLELKDDDNLEKLNLSFKRLGNKEIEFLSKFYISNLKILNLSYNLISDINVLEKVKFENLKELNLSSNRISDIEILERVKFNNLESLNLYYNRITDIKVLEKVKFEHLEILHLNFNQISDINVLEKVKFNNLKELYLNSNQISDIKVLERVKFNNLEYFSLGDNEISDIKVLEKVEFNNLRCLNLYNNEISDIKVFEKVKFNNLKCLNLYSNPINKYKYSLLIQNLKLKINELKI